MSLSSFPGANGGLDAAVRYVRTHHDVTFHATVPYETASHQPRPSERVRTAAYNALEACGCSVQPGSVSVIEKHRGEGVWSVTVRCEGGEEALALREAVFPLDQRKPSRAERGFTDSLREGGGDRLVASDWAALSDQSPDPSTFGIVFSYLVACCLGSSTVDGAGGDIFDQTLMRCALPRRIPKKIVFAHRLCQHVLQGVVVKQSDHTCRILRSSTYSPPAHPLALFFRG